MNDDTPTGRDLRTIWRTVTVAAIVISRVLGGIIYSVSEWVRLTARLEAVERWQAQKEKEAARELWRRERENRPTRSPEPKP